MRPGQVPCRLDDELARVNYNNSIENISYATYTRFTAECLTCFLVPAENLNQRAQPLVNHEKVQIVTALITFLACCERVTVYAFRLPTLQHQQE